MEVKHARIELQSLNYGSRIRFEEQALGRVNYNRFSLVHQRHKGSLCNVGLVRPFQHFNLYCRGGMRSCMILFISFSNGRTFLLQLYEYTNYIYLFCKLKMHFFFIFFFPPDYQTRYSRELIHASAARRSASF